jgi:hypothetical protein
MGHPYIYNSFLACTISRGKKRQGSEEKGKEKEKNRKKVKGLAGLGA